MNNTCTDSVHVIMVVSLVLLCSGAYVADAAGTPEHINSVTAITEVFGDGQKLTAVAVEYDKDVENAKLSKTTFSVAGRTITNVYANTTAAKAAQGTNGKYAIIELSTTDKGASIFVQQGRTFSRSAIKVSVTQRGDISTTDGELYASNTAVITNSKVVNLVVDDFKQLEYKNPKTGKTVKYNLFVPKNYDKNISYLLFGL